MDNRERDRESDDRIDLESPLGLYGRARSPVTVKSGPETKTAEAGSVAS